MILEALNFVATWAISGRRRAGEINSSVRLWARARRCSRDWAEHEANCKAFVRAHMPERGRVAVVLGSGLLRDVPVEALAGAFDEVRLYDLQHLASVRLWAKAKGLGNLRFLHRDLSDGLGFLRDDGAIDLVISANLLSQLGVAAERAGGDAAKVIADHLDGLRAAPGRRLLLTDRAFEIVLKDGRVSERHDLMHGVALPESSETWNWPVSPYGEMDPGYKAVHRVVAIEMTGRL
jgi:hypothetical protein